MRTLKYKAWHIEEKVMCDVSVINLELGAFLIGVKKGEDQIYDDDIVYAPENGRFCNWNEIEMLQFTGLTDKNGKETYEGDVVQDICADGFVIGFHDGGFTLERKGDYAEPLRLRYSGCEVIGNIHENPELIK